MAKAKEKWEKLNVRSYTSSFEAGVEMPTASEIERMRDMMEDLKPKVEAIKQLYRKLEEFLPVREKTLRLIAEAIVDLNIRHRKVNIAKVTGSSVSLVGDGLVIGGAIAAPFTLGFSLIATAIGGAVCAAGGITSAGAGIAEFCLSKKKVSEIQEAVDKDNKQALEIERMWRDIMGACTKVARKHSDTGHSVEDVLSVLLVFCIKKIPDKILSKLPIPKAFREKANEPELQKKAGCFSHTLQKKAGHFKESASYAMDVTGGVGTGVIVTAFFGKDLHKTVLTALAAAKGCNIVCDLGMVGSVVRKVVVAVKVIRIGAWINPAISVGLAAVGGVVDIASLIYSSYKIHKKSDSSAAKELAKVRDQLEESRDQMFKLKECLSDIINKT